MDSTEYMRKILNEKFYLGNNSPNDPMEYEINNVTDIEGLKELEDGLQLGLNPELKR